MRALPLLALLLCFAPAAAFAQGHDADRDRLLEIHADVIRAHLEGNVDLWMSLEAEAYTSVNSGSVSFPSLSARRAQRTAYLGATTFETYRDTRDPIVEISVDGTLGWLIAEVEVSGSSLGPDGEAESFHVFWAWIEMYEKDDGEWRLVGNVSNQR